MRKYEERKTEPTTEELARMNPHFAGSIERWLELNGIEPSDVNVELVRAVTGNQPLGKKVLYSDILNIVKGELAK